MGAKSPNTHSLLGRPRRLTAISKCYRVFSMCALIAVIVWNHQMYQSSSSDNKANIQTLENKSSCPSLMHGKGVPTFKTRNDIAAILNNEPGFHRGVELGVQHGHFSLHTLTNWPNCDEYHLVDLWGHQENYHDYANRDDAKQEEIYQGAMKRLKDVQDRIHVCRNYTTVCVKNFQDGYFDFIYVDARHDFKGVWEDMVAYWPKLRVGGIMAGHDYVTNDDGPLPRQDWSKNYDGTIDETGTVVKGAVDKFAESVCRQVTVSYREGSWNSWAIRK